MTDIKGLTLEQCAELIDGVVFVVVEEDGVFDPRRGKVRRFDVVEGTIRCAIEDKHGDVIAYASEYYTSYDDADKAAQKATLARAQERADMWAAKVAELSG